MEANKIKDEISKELTESQNNREVDEFSRNVNNFLNTLIEKTLTQEEIDTVLDSKLLDRLKDTETDTAMSDGALIELKKTMAKTKTDNANVISNIIKGMAEALLAKRGADRGDDSLGNVTKDDINDVKDAIKDITEIRKFLNDVIKTEK